MRKLIVSVVLLFVMAVVISAPAVAQPPTRPAAGTFNVQGYPCTEAGAGLCAVGTSSGTISGQVFVTIDTLVFDPVAFVQRYSGTITITSNKGTFYGTITNGTLTPVSNTVVLVNSTVNFTRGTGFYTNRVASLTVSGVVDPTTFVEVDSYVGTIRVAPR
jgi:hypothetical protein